MSDEVRVKIAAWWWRNGGGMRMVQQCLAWRNEDGEEAREKESVRVSEEEGNMGWGVTWVWEGDGVTNVW